MTNVLVKKTLLLAFMLTMMAMASAQSISYIEDFNLSNLQSFNGTQLNIGAQEGIPEGITFSPNGLKMFVAGQSGDEINQYSLSSPFNTNSGVTHDGFYSVAAQYTSPRVYGVAFSNDGLKMFVTGTSGSELTQYNLTTPFSITSGVTYNTSYNLPTSGDPGFITFKNDGTKMYVRNGTGIGQFSLSAAFDITSTITLEGTYTPSTYAPEEAVFTADGLTMLVIEPSGDIHQYDLTTPYEITSGVIDNSITFDVSGEETHPSGLAISSDNSSVFVLGNASGNQKISQYEMSIQGFSESAANDGTVDGSISIKIYGDTFTNQGGSLSEGVDFNIANLPSGLTPSISVAADGSSATLTFSGNASHHQAADDISFLEIVFENSAFTGNDASVIYNSDGSATPGISFENNKIISYGNQFNLSNGATYDLSYPVSSRQPLPRDVVFSSDGLKMFTIGADGGAEINQFTLASPFNIGSTITFNGNLNVSAQESIPTGFQFSNDGMKLFIVGGEINEYDLSSPFTITSGVTHSGGYSIPSGVQAISFSSSGKTLFLLTNTVNDYVYQYSLSSAYNIINIGSPDVTYSVGSQEIHPAGLAFNTAGTQMFVVGAGSDALHQYSLNDPFNMVSGVTYDGVFYDLSSEVASPSGITFNAEGNYFFVSDFSGQQDISQYKLSSDGFKESSNNNGAVDGFLTIQISGETFSNSSGSLTHGVDYSVTNLPSGLTPDLQINSNGTIAKLVFTGNASSHQNVDDLTVLDLTFENSSFASNNASDIQGLNDLTEVGIDFRDNNPSIFYGDGFNINSASYTYNSMDISSIESQATAIRLNNDGTKLFLIGRTTNAIHQYSLSAPYVIDENMTSDGAPYDVSGVLSDLYGLSFNNDGTKMYIVSNSTDDVHQFSLITPFDITGTVSYEGSYIISEDGFPVSVSFNSDGSRMFVIGTNADKILQYSLSTPFDVTGTVSFEGDFSVLSEEQSPRRIQFAAGGTRMLIIGSLGDEVNQYDLSVPYEITYGATFDTNFSMGSEDFGPIDFVFSQDGSVMYMLGIGYDNIYEYNIEKGGFSEVNSNDGSVEGNFNVYLLDETFTNVSGTLSPGTDYSISNLPAGLTPELTISADGLSASLSLNGNALDHQNVDDLTEIVITFENSAFTGGDASQVENSSSINTGLGIDFRNNNPTVYYGDALSLADMSYSGNSFNIAAQDGYATGIAFNNDGTRMYISGYNNGFVYEYSLTEGFDFSSTVAYTGNSLDISLNAQYPEDIYFSSEGNRLFLLSTNNYEVVQYNLTTPFDLSTASFSTTLNIAEQDDSPYGLTFSLDGSKMYMIGTNNYNIYQYSLLTPYEISSASYDGSPFYVENDQDSPTGIHISANGRKMIVVGDNGSAISYSLNVPFDLTFGATLDGTVFDLSSEDSSPSGVTSTPNGDKLFVIGYGIGQVSEYTIDVGGFTEALANDGTVEGSINIYIADDTFTNAGGSLTHGVDYTINNLPEGLNPSLSIASEGYSAQMTLSGSSTIHGDNEDIDGLNFTFNNTAFTNYAASQVGNVNNHSSIIGLDYLPYTDNDILSFTFSEVEGSATVNNTAHTVVAEAVAGTDVSAITPTIGLSQNATISPDTGIEQDFTSAVTYTVTAEDGTTQDWEITITEALAAPTDIVLSNSSIDENLSTNSLVGTFSTDDASFNDSYTYLFISGEGDEDNGSFGITIDELTLTPSADFETKDSYSIRVRTDDGNGGLFEKSFVISINDVNESPTDMALDNNTIDESNPVGTVVGSLSTTDEDLGQIHTYSFVAGSGDTDNTSFSISGSELISAEEFDFETKNSYSIRIRTSDGQGGTFDKIFTISINDLPAQITSITLSNQSVNENELSGALVGDFSTSGEDLSGSYSYSLVAGSGDNDNGSFSISGDQLLTSESFNFENKNSYSVLVMSNDGSLTETQVFSISVNDINDAPTNITLSGNTIAENNQINDVIGSFNSTDEDSENTFTYSLVNGAGDTDNASFDIVGNELQAAEAFDFETKNSYSVRIETNDGNAGTFSKSFTIAVANQNESILVANPIADQDLDEGFASIEIEISGVFTDQDGDDLTYEVSSSDETIVTVSNSGAILTITEVGNFGPSTVTVTADDGSGITTSDEFIVTVSNVNDAPIVANAVSDQNVNEGFSSLEIDFSNTFTDEDGDDLTLSVSSSDETVSTASISGTILTLTEVGIGSTTITVTTNDGNGGSVSDEFILSINNVNDAPVVVNAIADQTLDEGFASIELDLSATFSDEDGDDLTLSVASSDETVSTASLSGTILTLTEVGIGSTTITVTANDGNGGSVSNEFILSVNNVNGAPVVVNAIADQTLDEGFESIELDLSATFSDEDGDDLTLSVASSDKTVSTASLIGTILTLTEVGIGSATITITANDGNGGSASDEFILTVNELLNDAPVVVNPLDDQTEEEGFGAAQINYADVFEDPDGDVLTISVSSSDETVVTVEVITNDQIQINEVGVGTATITLTADDGNGGLVSDEFIVTVNEALSNETDIIEFSEPTQTEPAVIDAVNHTVSITIQPTSDLIEYNPTILVSEGATYELMNAFNGLDDLIYTVTAEDGLTTQDWIVTVIVDFSSTNGLEDEIDLQIYPNPTTDFLKVNTSETITAEVTNLEGRPVISRVSGTSLKLDVTSLSSGVYLLVITKDQKTSVKRFIKAN
ncbi:DUF5018 domain-containing protein [Ekhidna sp.]|uniref:DUF5018 domain-containing protein n=1 Tax=Ekhidna sp. TaxID=2608089 RepID=UPI003B50982E